MSNDPTALVELPVWAVRHAAQALQLGRKAPAIEQSLVTQGLSASIAAAAVDRCFDRRFRLFDHEREALARKRYRIGLALVGIGLALPAGIVLFAQVLGNSPLFSVAGWQIACVAGPELVSGYYFIIAARNRWRLHTDDQMARDVLRSLSIKEHGEL